MSNFSFRVMRVEEFEDSVYYRAACACGSHEHDVTIEIEIDKKYNYVSINFYKDIAWCSHWGSPNFFQRCWLKTKAICRILFTGYIELNEGFMLKGEQQILEFIEALKEGKKYVEFIN